MAITITNSLVQTAFAGFNAKFNEAFKGTPVWSNLIAEKIPSGTSSNIYHWLATLPRMREWVGPRQVENLRVNGYQLLNRHFELSMAIDRNTFEDDNIGAYAKHPEIMARQAAKLQDDLVVEALQSTTALCFDGLTFFHASHPTKFGDVGSPTYSNKRTGTDLTYATFNTVYQDMMAFADYDGKPIGVQPTHLIVPPGKRDEALYVVKTENIVLTAGDGASSNINRNAVEVVVVPELAGENTSWYLADLSKGIMPLIAQERKAPEFVSITDLASPSVYSSRQFEFGVDARMAVGYTFPFLMVKCTA